jgi:hypothetical protein
MIYLVTQFTDLTLQKTVKRALDFWYKKYLGDCNLIEFLHKCSLKQTDTGFVITYRGPAPENEEDII